MRSRKRVTWLVITLIALAVFLVMVMLTPEEPSDSGKLVWKSSSPGNEPQGDSVNIHEPPTDSANVRY
jgi:hypothetical protein